MTDHLPTPEESLARQEAEIVEVQRVEEENVVMAGISAKVWFDSKLAEFLEQMGLESDGNVVEEENERNIT